METYNKIKINSYINNNLKYKNKVECGSASVLCTMIENCAQCGNSISTPICATCNNSYVLSSDSTQCLD